MIIERSEHPIERIMDNALVKIRTLVDADTIIGHPVTTCDGVTIIPISKVAMGFLTGGGEYSDMSRENYTEYPFAGGSGAGISVAPIGFLVNDGKSIKLVNIDEKNPMEKILNLIPEVITEFLEGKSGKKDKK